MVLLPSLNEKLESSVCLFFFFQRKYTPDPRHILSEVQTELEVTELAVCQLRYYKK